MFVTTEIFGSSFKNVPSDSSASTIIHSPFPKRVFVPNSLIIPPRDSVNLSRAMKKVILDKNLKIKISQNGYEIAVNYFSTEKGLEKLSKIIKKTISDE